MYVPLFRKLSPLFPIYFMLNGIIAEELPLSEVTVSGWATNTTSISSNIPCLTITDFVPPRYSPGQPIITTEPPIFSIMEPNANAAATEVVVSRLCPVICPSIGIASYSHKKQILGLLLPLEARNDVFNSKKFSSTLKLYFFNNLQI